MSARPDLDAALADEMLDKENAVRRALGKVPLPSRDAAYADDRRVITIRKSTAEERAAKSPPIVAGSRRCSIPKWVVVYKEPTPGMLPFVCTCGMPDGGATRAEAVFWAERKASKNDLRFVRPDGWATEQPSAASPSEPRRAAVERP